MQNFFEISAARLESLGFAYENRLHIEHDYEIGSANGMLMYELVLAATTTDDEIDSVVSSYFGQCDNAICTSEYFSEFSGYHWKRLLESSLRLGVKLKVIFYVRNVIPFFLSAYDQIIKRHGGYELFDEWAEKAIWQHGRALQIMASVLPRSSIQVLHFDNERANLIKGFFNSIDADAAFEINADDQKRQVNRSLTNEEREVLITVNKALGAAYSKEVSELLIYADPNARGEPVSYHKTTADSLLDRYNTEVNWVNNTFFNGQAVVSVLPTESIKETPCQKLTTEPKQKGNVEKQVLDWSLEKLKTIKDETEQTIMDAVYIAAQNTLEKSHPDIPADFDVLAYLLINRDVLHSGVNPIKHFIDHGKREGRAYKL
ncbi:hypothetical protein [Candidatus Methylobacter favarea]|uniref:hypothetical protein n=1 Tax=Candidatus Methylobacter favarea TaxID=2707345 RepID=UPI00157D3E3F|nr:hypothetical protein [Candidatus Methylobacter favarea]